MTNETRSPESYPADIEIARGAEMKSAAEIADGLGIGAEDLVPYGAHKAKVRRQPPSGWATLSSGSASAR
jgi:formate--tetrahydrofolate ligase